MSQLTPQEQKIMDLFDAGLTARRVAHRTGLSLPTVEKTIQMYNWSMIPDRRREASIALGSKTLLRNVLAAGGHR